MKEKSFFYGIIALVVMLALSVFTSCDSDMEDFSLNVKPNEGGGDNTEVTITVTRDSENGTVVSKKLHSFDFYDSNHTSGF